MEPGSFFLAYRKLFDPANKLHPHAQNVPACPGFAWLDIVANARWKNGGGLHRGEWLASVRFLAVRWNWSKDRVQRFLRLLQSECAIEYHPQQGRRPAHIVVCNYERYQVPRDTGKDVDKDADKDANKDEEVRSKKGKKEKTTPPVGSDEPTVPVVREIFEFWKAQSGHTLAHLTEKRRTKIKARLRTYTAEQVKAAIRAACRDPFYLGDNDRGKRYDYLETILKSDEAVERHIDGVNGAKPEGFTCRSCHEHRPVAQHVRGGICSTCLSSGARQA